MANFRQIGTNFTNGLRAPHYVNGRLLTAEDLQNDQRANLDRIGQTGRGAGMGIIEGFNVTSVSNRSSLRVTAGTGINGKGDVVQLLAEDAVLPIQPVEGDESAIRRSGRFGECEEGGDETSTPLSSGAYLLTVVPLARLEGSVPRQSSNGTETATCANQWEVEGVEFKIIRLVGYQQPTGSRSQRNQNLLAHWFYGSDKLCNLMRDPFQFNQSYTGFNNISAEDFDDCDLSLAVFFWDDNQISFVDEWSARRRLVHPYPGTGWKANIGDQRVAESEARFLQFQTQIDVIRSRFGVNTSQQKAVTHFGYLPPVGFLPINPFELIYVDIFIETIQKSDELLSEIRQRELSIIDVFNRVETSVLSSFENNNLFRLENFFDDLLPSEYQIVHEDLIHDRLHQSWVQPPIALPSPPVSIGNTLVAGFDFVTAVGEQVAVAAADLSAVTVGVLPAISNVKLTQTIADRLTRVPNDSLSPNRPNRPRPVVGDDDELPVRPIGAAAPPSGRNEFVEPLVELLVVDELLEPYRELLTKEMPAIISSAITSLSTGGGIFTGSNRFKAATAEIRNRFTANVFIAAASIVGVGRYVDLVRLVNQTKTPLFYVAFVRHRPEVIRRPLILPDFDNQDG